MEAAWHRVALIVAFALAATLVPVAGSAPTLAVVVNLKTGANHGCSDDVTWNIFSFPTPDLQARVWYQGAVVYSTVEAENTSSPDWYELAEFSVARLPAVIHLEVREAEPGVPPEALSWVSCDIDPGPGTMLEVTIPVEGVVDIDTRGDTAGSARLIARAASALVPHPKPVTLAATPEPNCLRLSWAAAATDPGGVKQWLQLDGRPTSALPTNARSYDWCGLAENSDHHARLRRTFEGWSVWRTPQAFATTNGPPPAPVVVASDGFDEINVTWSVAANDGISVVVHCGRSEGFVANAATRCATGRANGGATIPFSAGTVHLRVQATDSRGAANETLARANATERPPPPAPVLRPAESLHLGARIAWDAPTTAGVGQHVVRVWKADPREMLREHHVPVPATSVFVEIPAGTYIVDVRAINANGGTGAPAEAQIAHVPPNAAPTLNVAFRESAAWTGRPVLLDIRAEDPDQDEVSIEVDWGDGTKIDAARQHTYADSATYSITVTARDPFGLTTTRTLEITVARNAPPVVDLRLSPARAALQQPVQAIVRAEDPEGGALTLVLDWGDGSPHESVDGSALHRYQRPGIYAVRLVARDSGGAQAAATASIQIEGTSAPADPTSPPATPRPESPAGSDPAAPVRGPQEGGEATGATFTLTPAGAGGGPEVVDAPDAADEDAPRETAGPGLFGVVLVLLGVALARRGGGR